MNDNTIARFTDERYCDKAAVQKMTQGSIMAEETWKRVLAYRQDHSTVIPFQSLRRKNWLLVWDDAIEAKIQLVDRQIQKAIEESIAPLRSDELEDFSKAAFLKILRAISLLESASMNDLSLKALFNGTYGESNQKHQAVINYYRILSDLCKKQPTEPDEIFIGDCLAKMLGQGEELTSFYRTSDPDRRAVLIQYKIDDPYPYAPASDIDWAMDGFEKWLESSSDSPFLKAAISLFIFDYVMPFERYSKEIGSLLAKMILALDYGPQAFYLPLEELFFTPGYDKAKENAQRYNDLTYVVLFIADQVRGWNDGIRSASRQAKIDRYRPEFTALTGEERRIADELNVAPKEESKPIQFFDIEEEESKPAPAEPVAPTPIPEPKPVVEEKPVPQNSVPPTKVISKEEFESASGRGGPSLSFKDEGLSDKEVKEYIRYLLETNPNLNRHQASFLASHCTMGRFYTIQQFKKHARCAYETARTSMDKLAKEGYYEKMQVKNKFVYTPRRKGE